MKVKTNSIELNYKKTGTGPALILLHGNGEDHQIFDALSEKLKADYTLYAIDSRNHGQSSQTNEFGYDTMASDIYGFITELQLGPVYLLGFSDGAIISLLLASAHPEVVSKMALLGVNLKPEDFTDDCYRSLQEAFEKGKDPLVQLMLEEPNIPLDSLADITTPSLIVAGEQDIFKPETFVAIAQTMPHAELLVMKNHGHDSYITRTALLAPNLLTFLAD